MDNLSEKEALNLLSGSDFVPILHIETEDGEWSDNFFTGRSDVVMVFDLDRDALKSRACKVIAIELTMLCIMLLGLLPDADDGSFKGTDFSDPGAAVMYCLFLFCIAISLWVAIYQYFHTHDNHVALTCRGVEVHQPLPPSCFLSHLFSTEVFLYGEIHGIVTSSEVVKLTHQHRRKRFLSIVGLQDPGSFVNMVCTNVKTKEGKEPEIYGTDMLFRHCVPAFLRWY